MNTFDTLQALLNNTATEEDIALLKRLLASGEISISGNVNQSVIIIGSGNTVELPSEALDRLNARPMLGNLDRDLTGDEIASGLRRLGKLLQNRAPILMPEYKDHAERLRSTLKTEENSLSKTARDERTESLAAMNRICLEAVDISFNGLCLDEEAPKYDARSPFRGLESFRPEDSEFFFGREALTEKLVAKIKVHSFLAVLGASGSGKSSLVMAGVIPALGLDYAIVRPGENPLEALESAKGKALLVVDQFEELFTLTKNEDKKIRADFISAVLDFARSGKVIITLRSDFLSEVGAYRSLSKEIQNHLETILPMDTDGLRRAMEGQARLTKLEFEADLSQQILEDVDGEPGAMPLLQHALWELWNRRHGRHLRASEYRAFGGVKQAIASTAEQVYGECSKVEQEQLREIFLRLTTLDKNDEGRDTRRRVSLSGLAFSRNNDESTNLLLDKLANARLIVKSVNGDKTEVEVVHEALIRHWERLRIWLNEDRDALRLRESVSESAVEWERSGRHESLLNSRWVKLDEALLLVQDSRYRLTEIEQAYLRGCVRLRNREQRERERRLRYTMFVSIAAAVIFLALGSFGLVKSNEATSQAKTAQAVSTLAFDNAATAQANADAAATAQANAEVQKLGAERQARIALARQLSSQSQFINVNRNSNQMIATLIAIVSMKLFPTGEAADFLINKDLTAKELFFIPHQAKVNVVVVSPDGKYAASGSNDHLVRVWEITTGKEIARMSHDNDVTSLAFSSDSKYIVSGSYDKTARFWELTTGKEISRVTHEHYVTSVAISPDGKYAVSGSYDNTARVWETSTGAEVSRMTQDGDIHCVTFSPDGKYVVSGSSKTARVWETYTGKETARMDYDDGVLAASFSPDGKYIVSGSYDNTARVWEADTGREISRMTHNSSVTSVTFSPGGKYIVSGSSDKTARVWDVVSGKEISRMTFDDEVTSVAFSSDGQYVVSGSRDHTAHVWEINTGREVARMTHEHIVSSVAFSPDSNYIISGSWDSTARVWALNNNITTQMDQNDYITSFGFSADGKYLVSGSEDNTARVWETETGNEVSRMTHKLWVNSVAISPDGKFAISGSGADPGSDDKDYTARVWETITGKKISLMTFENDVTSVSFSPDGKYVMAGSADGTTNVWEPNSGIVIASKKYKGSIFSQFSPNGKYIATVIDKSNIVIWEVSTQNEISRMSLDGSTYSVAFSPDGRYIASGSDDGNVRVWDVMTGKEIARIEYDLWVLSNVAFSPNSKYLISGSYDNTARVLDVNNGKEIARMTHDEAVISVDFSPDGDYVVSGSRDGTTRVWKATTGEEVARLTSNHIITAVAFSPNGKFIVSGDIEGQINIWIWQPQDLITSACAFLPRNLTRAEWDQYIGDALPYQAVCPNLPIEPEAIP